MRFGVDSLRNYYFDELRGNPALKGAPVHILGSYSAYMTDLLWCEPFAKKLGGKILRLFTRTGRSTTMVGFEETYKDDSPESYGDYFVHKVKSDYRYEDHGASELHDRFVAIRKMRGGDADVPVGMIYYFNPKWDVKYWLYVSVHHRRIYGDFSVWGNVVTHFLNDWISAKIPEEEQLYVECKVTRGRKDEKTGQERKRRSPISLDLVACDEIDFLKGDYLDFQNAIIKAHDSRSEELVRKNLTPVIKGTDAETRLLFFRNEYYPSLPEMPRIYNVRRYLSPLEALR